ncbi:MAG TPA: hypothetical protein VJ577_00505 [Burkholderiaceae bacterium]|nr:hypothetical protein [Burkholderiaceae bacterium]
MTIRACVLPWLLAARCALAEDADLDALQLADRAPTVVEHASDWRLSVEAAAGEAKVRGGTPLDTQRLSFDIEYDKRVAPGWRAVLANRLDMTAQGALSDKTSVNTLKEAYLSWQPRADRLLDLGRINARLGVATGYNPTDFFRDNAIRSVVSVDPVSLKKNRLGSAMLRGQTLWEGGSLTALYSPKLASAPDDAPFSPDFGATNNRNRWLVAVSQPLFNGINPQWLIYREGNTAPQFGVNLTGLLNDATVAYVEWAGGRSRSQLSRALNGIDDSAFRNRLATGMTWTTAGKLSLTLEYQYDGAALDAAGWEALGRRSPILWWQYRKWVQDNQELPVRHAAFLYASWQDAIIHRLDLNAMVRVNQADHSRMSWLEARYRWERTDLALQWQFNSGRTGSEFGALPQQRVIQLLLRRFF